MKFFFTISCFMVFLSCNFVDHQNIQKKYYSTNILFSKVPLLKIVSFESDTIFEYYGVKKIAFQLGFNFLKLNDSTIVINDWRKLNDTLVFKRNNNSLLMRNLREENDWQFLLSIMKDTSSKSRIKENLFADLTFELIDSFKIREMLFYNFIIVSPTRSKNINSYMLTKIIYNEDEFIHQLEYSNEYNSVQLKLKNIQ